MLVNPARPQLQIAHAFLILAPVHQFSLEMLNCRSSFLYPFIIVKMILTHPGAVKLFRIGRVEQIATYFAVVVIIV
jgi:hypothetical protein